MHRKTCPDEKIRQVVESKRQWIYEKTGHPQKYRDLPHAPGKELVSGESALYLGRLYRIEVVHDGLEHVQFSHGFLIPERQSGQRVEALREWYIARGKEKLVPRVERHARILGVDITGVKIVDNRYRWGSCTLNDYVSLNWRLMKAPMFVIDYVIVHELTHLIETNHTPRFWNIVRTQIATTEKAKAWLREHGQLLEEVI
jgi:predicted metal-dependent hydrolase